MPFGNVLGTIGNVLRIYNEGKSNYEALRNQFKQIPNTSHAHAGVQAYAHGLAKSAYNHVTATVPPVREVHEKPRVKFGDAYNNINYNLPEDINPGEHVMQKFDRAATQYQTRQKKQAQKMNREQNYQKVEQEQEDWNFPRDNHLKRNALNDLPFVNRPIKKIHN